MTLILENLGKLFTPKYKSLDGKFWVQKVILKKSANSSESNFSTTDFSLPKVYNFFSTVDISSLT